MTDDPFETPLAEHFDNGLRYGTTPEMISEIKYLRTMVYAPGRWRCAKCGFTLLQSNLNALDGTITANDKPGDVCPNDGSPLWRVSWKQEAEEAMTIAERIFDEKKSAHDRGQRDMLNSILALNPEAANAVVGISEGDQANIRPDGTWVETMMEADSRRFVDLRSGETGLLVIDGNGEIISGPTLDQLLDEFHAARRPSGDFIEDKSNG